MALVVSLIALWLSIYFWRRTRSPDEAQKRQQQDTVRDFLSRREITGIAVAVWVYLICLFLLRLYIYDHVSDSAKASEVLIASMFSLAIVIVVVIHAVMYHKQAKAMIAQTQAAEQNTIYAQRAYVYARIGEVSPDDVFDLALLIENSGNSPANDVKVFYSAGFRDVEPHETLGDWKRFTGRPASILGLLPPKINFCETIYNRPVPTPAELKKYYARGCWYCCWGVIYYKDVFGGDWYTMFAFSISKRGVIKYDVRPCLSGNKGT